MSNSNDYNKNVNNIYNINNIDNVNNVNIQSCLNILINNSNNNNNNNIVYVYDKYNLDLILKYTYIQNYIQNYEYKQIPIYIDDLYKNNIECTNYILDISTFNINIIEHIIKNNKNNTILYLECNNMNENFDNNITVLTNMLNNKKNKVYVRTLYILSRENNIKKNIDDNIIIFYEQKIQYLIKSILINNFKIPTKRQINTYNG